MQDFYLGKHKDFDLGRLRKLLPHDNFTDTVKCRHEIDVITFESQFTGSDTHSMYFNSEDMEENQNSFEKKAQIFNNSMITDSSFASDLALPSNSSLSQPKISNNIYEVNIFQSTPLAKPSPN